MLLRLSLSVSLFAAMVDNVLAHGVANFDDFVARVTAVVNAYDLAEVDAVDAHVLVVTTLVVVLNGVILQILASAAYLETHLSPRFFATAFV